MDRVTLSVWPLPPFTYSFLFCNSPLPLVFQEIPMVNIISKADLVDKESLDRVLDMDSAGLLARTDPGAVRGRLGNLTR